MVWYGMVLVSVWNLLGILTTRWDVECGQVYRVTRSMRTVWRVGASVGSTWGSTQHISIYHPAIIINGDSAVTVYTLHSYFIPYSLSLRFSISPFLITFTSDLAFTQSCIITLVTSFHFHFLLFFISVYIFYGLGYLTEYKSLIQLFHADSPLKMNDNLSLLLICMYCFYCM